MITICSSFAFYFFEILYLCTWHTRIGGIGIVNEDNSPKPNKRNYIYSTFFKTKQQ